MRWSRRLIQTLRGVGRSFRAFVSRRTKGKYKNITSLKSKAGVSVTGSQGKLEVSQRYDDSGKVSVDQQLRGGLERRRGCK